MRIYRLLRGAGDCMANALRELLPEPDSPKNRHTVARQTNRLPTVAAPLGAACCPVPV